MNTPRLATWLQMADSATIEALSFLGIQDFVIDMEHSALTKTDLVNLLRTTPNHEQDITKLVRVSANSMMAIRQPLDLGAEGIIVPMVNNEEEAKRAVGWAMYPPNGIRGTSYCRMNDWGAHFDFYQKSADYLPKFVMIETKEGLENVEKIVAVPFVDGVIVGHYDLSSFLGCPGNFAEQSMIDAETRIVEACLSREKVAGALVFVPSQEAFARLVERGFNWISIGSDLMFMRSAAELFFGEAHEYIYRKRD